MIHLKTVMWVFSFAAIISLNSAQAADTVERWGVFELTLNGPSSGNPYLDVQWSAEFTQGTQRIKVPGFWDSASTYKIRFSPPTTGEWSYQTVCTVPELNGKTGTFQVTNATGDNHGPVQILDTFYLRFADGTPYFQVGTTCYAWVHQTDTLQQLTLQTLATSPFNKIRMTVFPKDYTYNKNDPPYYAFLPKPGTPAGKYDFDYTKPNPVFWHHFEKRILDLQKLGIEADIILFHPYDRWGFKSMGAANDDRYIRYCIARFSAYRHVWWSLANEWQFCAQKDTDFVRFAKIVMNEDPHHRMSSVHCCDYCYWTPPPPSMSYSMPYFTHAGIQGSCEDRGMTYRSQWKKPLIWDESCYEGNIPEGFGNLTAFQMTQRFWFATFNGTYQGHGECFKDPNDVLWWAKGGVLKGQSPVRIKWFKEQMAQAPAFNELKPQSPNSNIWMLSKQGKYYMVYCRNTNSNSVTLPGTSSYKVTRLDPYEMTETPVGAGTTSPGTYTFTPPKADVIYRFISSDYTGIEGKEEAGKRRDFGNSIKVVSKTVKLDFEHSVLKENLSICLFDLSGKQVAEIFKGRLSSPHVKLSLDRADIQSGGYVIRILSLDHKVDLIKTIMFQ
jgi:hypothetical protein